MEEVRKIPLYLGKKTILLVWGSEEVGPHRTATWQGEAVRNVPVHQPGCSLEGSVPNGDGGL